MSFVYLKSTEFICVVQILLSVWSINEPLTYQEPQLIEKWLSFAQQLPLADGSSCKSGVLSSPSLSKLRFFYASWDCVVLCKLSYPVWGQACTCPYVFSNNVSSLSGSYNLSAHSSTEVSELWDEGMWWMSYKDKHSIVVFFTLYLDQLYVAMLITIYWIKNFSDQVWEMY